MTFVLNRAVDEPPIHVLIVALEDYQGAPSLAPLPGLRATVGRLIEYWTKLPGHRLLGRAKSIDLLFSSHHQPTMKGLHGEDVDKPTHQKVREALLQWTGKLRSDGGLGVLHWIGHGFDLGDRGVALPVLLCCDPDMQRRQKGLRWGDIRDYIDYLKGDAKAVCFIDACRTKAPADAKDWRAYQLPELLEVTENSTPPTSLGCMEFFTTAYGGATHSHAAEAPALRVPGGALSSEAILRALRHLAWTCDNATLGNAIQSFMVQHVVRRLRKCWFRRLNEPFLEPGSAVETREMTDLPIVLPERARSIVEIKIAGERPLSGRTCTFNLVGSNPASPPQPLTSDSVIQSGDYWVSEADCGAWRAEFRHDRSLAEIMDRPFEAQSWLTEFEVEVRS